MRLLYTIGLLALLAPLAPRAQAQTQAPIGSMLHIELENATVYISDCPSSQLATSASKLDRPLGGAFEIGFAIADIVSVNGRPVKGTAYETVLASIVGSPNPVPRGALVDSPRTAVLQWDLDFVNPDGTAIGTIQISGLNGGPPPPGAPKEIGGGAYTVIAGTGAFFGVRGYFQPVQDRTLGERVTSACEDPAFRRVNAEGRGKRHPVLYLVPMTRPEILITPTGPAILHASVYSVVTAAKPVEPGELLTLYASGLGPTRPGVDPGQPFTSDPPQMVNSPVEVLVNGKPGEVLYAGGYAGAVDGYQVNFRIPDGTASGQAFIQLNSAWIVGGAVKIAVR